MTDKINDKIKSQDMEPLNASDEQFLQAFFADNMMAGIPDDGFSDRVMQALPAMETEQSLLEFHIANMIIQIQTRSKMSLSILDSNCLINDFVIVLN